MKLLIISHTPHYQLPNSIVGWGPTVREVDQLATLFKTVMHLAPLHNTPPPGSALPYTAENVRLRNVKPAGGNSFKDKLNILVRLPGWLAAMREAMQQADAIHIRCPAGISLLALLAAWIWSKGKPIWVKYAGNWHSYPGQALSYKFQRWFLKSHLHPWAVTINGKWEEQPDHIISFNNPSFSEAEYKTASEFAKMKQLSFPLKFLFVGNLTNAKGVHHVLDIVKILRQRRVNFELTLVGDSIERVAFENYVSENALERIVHFAGWQPKHELGNFYRSAHFILLPSTSEGWPKVLSEAMAYGVVPLASTVSSIPQILQATGAGLAIPAEDTAAYIDAILGYTQDRTAWQQASRNGVDAAQQFTYEAYLEDVRLLFKEHWQIELNHG